MVSYITISLACNIQYIVLNAFALNHLKRVVASFQKEQNDIRPVFVGENCLKGKY